MKIIGVNLIYPPNVRMFFSSINTFLLYISSINQKNINISKQFSGNMKTFRRTVISNGISFGSALAIVLSYVQNGSILWAMFHGLLSWVYVVYFIVVYRLLF